MDLRYSISEPHYLIGLIGDEETTIGFLLAGVAQTFGSNPLNRDYLVVNEDTSTSYIETFFLNLYKRKEIGIILIGSDVYKKILPAINNCDKHIPIIIEIPTKKSLAEEAHTL